MQQLHDMVYHSSKVSVLRDDKGNYRILYIDNVLTVWSVSGRCAIGRSCSWGCVGYTKEWYEYAM